MPATGCNSIGVTIDKFDGAVRNPQKIADDLRKAGFVPLTDCLGACDQRDRVVSLEPDFDVFVWRATGSLDVIGKAETPQMSFCLAFRATLGEPIFVCPSKYCIEAGREVSAIDGSAQCVADGHVFRAIEVLPAKFGCVEAAFACRGVDQAFDYEAGFREARSAGHTKWRSIRVDGGDLHGGCRNIVNRARQMTEQRRLHQSGAARHVCTDIRSTFDLQCQESAFRAQR